MKKYINSIEELQSIPLIDRPQYYLNRSLYLTHKGFTENDEEIIYLNERSTQSFLVRPFWNDKPIEVEDLLLKNLLELEGNEVRNYISDNPNFMTGVRHTVYEKLCEAQSHLPKDIKIVLKAGFRPIQIQHNLFLKLYKAFELKFPTYNKDEIRKLTLEYVSDPTTSIPPHSTGAAVDITLFNDIDNVELDMGTPVNFPGEESWTFNNRNLTQLQIKNRKLITDTMLKANFANLASEWWHYSYGDQRWAVFYDKQDALYNSAE